MAIYKLNSQNDQPSALAVCDASTETSENQIPVDLAILKKQVANYQSVMLGFGVPQEHFFSTMPVNISHLLSFISKNWIDLAAMRIYFAKKTSDIEIEDYELFFVPCSSAIDEFGNVFYQDKLETTAGIISILCKTPPGCPKGAALLPVQSPTPQVEPSTSPVEPPIS